MNELDRLTAAWARAHPERVKEWQKILWRRALDLTECMQGSGFIPIPPPLTPHNCGCMQGSGFIPIPPPPGKRMGTHKRCPCDCHKTVEELADGHNYQQLLTGQEA